MRDRFPSVRFASGSDASARSNTPVSPPLYVAAPAAVKPHFSATLIDATLPAPMMHTIRPASR